MSPDTGNIHSNNVETTGTVKENETSAWFQKLMNNRVLPLSSKSQINIGIPPIVTGIWRKISDFSNQAVHLPILRAVSLPVLTGPIKHSKVWGRLLDLPLLQSHQRQKNRLFNTSRTSTEKQSYQKEQSSTDISPDYDYSKDVDDIEVEENTGILTEPAISAQPEVVQMFSDITDMPQAEGHSDSSGESTLKTQLERIKKVSEGKLFDTAAGNEVIKSPINKEKPLHSDDSINRQTQDGSASGFSKAIVQKSEKSIESNIVRLHDERSISKDTQKFNRIPQSYTRQSIHSEDIPKKYEGYSQPVYNIQEPASFSIQYIKENDSEHDDVIPVEKDREQIITDYIPGLPYEGRMPESDMQLNIPVSKENPPIDSKQLSPAVQRSIQLTHSPSILQKVYLKIKDAVIKPGIQALQLTYKKDIPPAEKPSQSIKLPIQRQNDIIRTVSPVEHTEPVDDVDIKRRTVPEIGIEKTVIEMLSNTSDIEKSFETPDIKLSPVQKTGTKALRDTVLSMSPIIKLWVERPSTQKMANNMGSIPMQIKKSFPFIKPVDKISSFRPVIAKKNESAISNPIYSGITGLFRYKQHIYADNSGMQESSSLRHIDRQKDTSFSKGISNRIFKQDIKDPDSRIQSENYRSLDLLFANNDETRKTADTIYYASTSLPRMHVDSTSRIPTDSADIKQSIKEPLNLLERYLADRQISEQNKAETKSMKGQLPVSSTHKTGDSLSREISISRSAAIDESDMIAAGNSEQEPPDLDAIARDVYIILKRRIIRERERAFGLS